MSAFNTGSVVPFWIDGKEQTSSTTFDVLSPLDGKTLYKCSSASLQDVAAAITSAEAAFKTWSKTKPAVRRDIFLKAAQILEKRRDEAWTYEHTEAGANEVYFGFDFSGAVEALNVVAGLIGTVSAGTVPTLGAEGQSAMILREPYGVVLGIAPWNATYILGLRACLQPLAMGNTVILKGPEVSPAAYWFLGSVLHEAGLPSGCLNTLYHQPSDAAKITDALIASPSIKKISFTGSTATGCIIASLAGKHLKPTVMELGGKAPSIVCEDADLELAAMQCALGAFLHSGQICMSTERIVVHESIAEKFKEKLRSAIDNVFGGPGAEASALIAAVSVTKNKKLVQDALDKGAKTVYGDAAHNDATATRMRPLVIEQIDKNMDIYYTESFGPTVSLFTVKSDEEAIEIANDTEYGLASAVFTEDLRRGLRIAKAIETGAVHINHMSVHDEPDLPHGGSKKSGFGRFNSTEGLLEWVRTKNITWKD